MKPLPWLLILIVVSLFVFFISGEMEVLKSETQSNTLKIENIIKFVFSF